MSAVYRAYQYWIAVFIAIFEGYGDPGSIARQNNNPGNLRRWGNRPRRAGYAVFETPGEGWRALFRQVDLNIRRGLTLLEFFGGKSGVYPGYAPAEDGNDPRNYAGFVARRTGIPVDSVSILQFIRRREREIAA